MHGRRLKVGLASAALLSVLAAGLIAAVPGLRSVGHRLGSADPGWVAVAAALEIASCASFVTAFRLVFPAVPRWIAARVAWAEMAFGAVVPLGGAGGVAVGAWILNAAGTPPRDAVRRSAVLFLYTSAVNVVVMIAAGLGVLASGGPHVWLRGALPAAAAGATLLGFLKLPAAAPDRITLPDRVQRWVTATGAVVADTRRTAMTPTRRAAGAWGYLLFDIAALWACFRAFGDSPPVAALIVAYQIGYLANLVPLPGGVGVLEGGLIGALALYGISPTRTAAAVVLYHALALWIPAGGGTMAFARLRHALHDRYERAT